MIKRTFLILPSIGRKTEMDLWKRGMTDWDQFIDARSIPGISPARKSRLDEHLVRARHFLERGRTDYFSKVLPTNEHWRIYGRFREDTAFLDIETDSQGPYANVTVVGIHRNGRTRTLVRGQDLSSESIKEALDGCKLLVTFNGSSFDLPILGYHYPLSVPRVPHFDLRHGCHRIGLDGGLKRIERIMGIQREREVEFVTGEEAVYLWRAWERRRRKNALNLLLKYNEEDTKNMVPLADHVYETLSGRLVNRSD
jgi:uncharacterized protein YprB with RNaseH-like and TPR domain